MSDRTEGLIPTPEGYADWLVALKDRIHAAQQRATLAVNRELVLLYWHIGRDILARQADQGWGAKVIDRLAHDLRTAFPDMKGFSRAISNTCALSQTLGPTPNLRNRLLHYCLGVTTWCCWTG